MLTDKNSLYLRDIVAGSKAGERGHAFRARPRCSASGPPLRRRCSGRFSLVGSHLWALLEPAGAMRKGSPMAGTKTRLRLFEPLSYFAADFLHSPR